jgi:cyclic-di-GMP-binding protein
VPSFDLVSEVNVQEVDNAVQQAQKEIAGRYDFKGKKVGLEFEKSKFELSLSAEEETHLNSLFDIVASKLHKRGIELSALEIGKVTAVGGKQLKQTVVVRQGIETTVAKKIIKLVKDAKLKVETSIQDKQIRVTGKKIDDLQEVIAMVRQNQSELGIPFQFVNMRS